MLGRKYLAIAVAVLSVTSAPAIADVKAGIDAYQRGDFATAVSTWQPLALAGDADAQYNLGQAYRLGRGVPVDAQAAEGWFRKAADQGHARARNAYGLTLFQDGRRQQALPYIEESAGQGFPQSQYVFATLLFNGDMVEKDWVRSYALMTRAAAGDVEAAKAGLAQLDKYIPEDQRQRGLKLAQVFEASSSSSPAAQTAGSAIANEAMPPSRVAPVKSLPTKPATVTAAPKIAPAKTAPVTATPAKPVAVKVPAPVAVATASSRPVPSGAWRVQLGAFSAAGAASTLWTNLHGRIAALGPYRSFVVPARKVTRLQAGPLLGRAAADALCTAVRAAGNPCLVVAP